MAQNIASPVAPQTSPSFSAEPRRESKQEHAAFRQARNRSRPGRFPVRANDNHRPLNSVSVNSNPGSHSPPSRVFRSPDVVPLKLGDIKRRSQSTSDTSWSSSQSHRHCFILRKPSLSETSQSSYDDGEFSQHLHELDINSTVRPVAKPDVFAASIGLGSTDLPSVLPLRRPQAQPVVHSLRLAQTVFMSVYQVHWLVQALASLTEYQFSFQQAIRNANLRVEELAREIKKYNRASGQALPNELDSTSLERACAAVLTSYTVICTHITRLSDFLVDQGDAGCMSSLISLLYSSIMSLRAGLMQHTPLLEDIDLTMRPSHGSESQEPHYGKESPSSPSTISGSPRSHTAVKPSTQAPHFAISDTITSKTTHARVASDLRDGFDAPSPFYALVFRCCKLVSEVLPGLNAIFYKKVKEAERRNLPQNFTKSWQSLRTSCSKVVERAASLEKALSTAFALGSDSSLPRGISDMCDSFVDAWIALGTQLQASHSLVKLSLQTRKNLTIIQRSIKEIASEMNSVVDASPVRFTRSGSSSPSPMTPLKASLGPAAQATSPVSSL